VRLHKDRDSGERRGREERGPTQRTREWRGTAGRGKDDQKVRRGRGGGNAPLLKRPRLILESEQKKKERSNAKKKRSSEKKERSIPGPKKKILGVRRGMWGPAKRAKRGGHFRPT